MDNWHWILVERIGEWRTLSCMSFSWRTVSCSCRWVTATTLQKILLQLSHQHQERSIHTLITCSFTLQKQDEKYLLKFHTGSGGIVPGANRDEVKKILSPVIKFSTMIVSSFVFYNLNLKKYITNKITIDDRCGPWRLTSELSTWWTRPRWARSCTSW